MLWRWNVIFVYWHIAGSCEPASSIWKIPRKCSWNARSGEELWKASALTSCIARWTRSMSVLYLSWIYLLCNSYIQYPEREQVFKSWPMWFHKVDPSYVEVYLTKLDITRPSDRQSQPTRAGLCPFNHWMCFSPRKAGPWTYIFLVAWIWLSSTSTSRRKDIGKQYYSTPNHLPVKYNLPPPKQLGGQSTRHLSSWI